MLCAKDVVCGRKRSRICHRRQKLKRESSAFRTGAWQKDSIRYDKSTMLVGKPPPMAGRGSRVAGEGDNDLSGEFAGSRRDGSALDWKTNWTVPRPCRLGRRSAWSDAVA